MSNFDDCKQALKQGKFDIAIKCLDLNPEIKKDHRYLFYRALCRQTIETAIWERAHNALKEDAIERLYACRKIARLYKEARDKSAERRWLQMGAQTAHFLGDRTTELELRAAYASRLLNDGMKSEGISTMQDALHQAIETGEDNLIVALGSVMGGVLMSQSNWTQASAISIAVEEASLRRKNWIGFACGRMMRSTCRFHLGQEAESVKLLFDAGNQLIERGAVSALNCIKARLIEIKIQIGDNRFESLCKGYV